MRGLLRCLTLCLLLWSCEKNREATEELSVYFDLDSVLDQQVLVLSREGYPVSKTVTMDGKTETQTSRIDSAGWEEEFAIIRDFDLNKPYNVGAYERQEEGDLVGQRITYSLSDSTLDAPVKWFSVLEGQTELNIYAEYFEDKTIYQHRRKLRLILERGLLKSYEITGFQKMVMKDTIRYRIEGEIKINE